jgi:hypothetical protein
MRRRSFSDMQHSLGLYFHHGSHREDLVGDLEVVGQNQAAP